MVIVANIHSFFVLSLNRAAIAIIIKESIPRSVNHMAKLKTGKVKHNLSLCSRSNSV